MEQEYAYEYDGMSQLIRAVLSQTTTTAEGKKQQEKVTTSYVYDPAGNRLKMSTDRNGSLSTVTYTYDEAGRLVRSEDSEQGETVYAYDGAGNLIREENTSMEGGIKYYQYDAADRLTAVMDNDNLLLAALYDGNGNRVFTMEYAPELIKSGAVRVPDGQEEEEGRKPSETAALPESGAYKDTKDEKEEDSEGTEGTASGAGTSGSDSTGRKAFWYGVLCQAADIFLPAPTPFKAWLHEKMGFTDSVSVLFEKEVYEADLSRGGCSIQEEGSPFALVNNAVKASTGKELSSEAYRQVSYVNDISFSNEQVLMEKAVNGSMGESVTGYSYGMWRESYCVEAGTGASVGLGTGSGTYYYTGTGSVANLVSGSGTRGYSYGPGGTVTVYGQASMESQTKTQAGFYSYNGEYTHGSLGLQYLRARYLKVETGTFTSRDTYAGRVRDILSQNRYTYAENNPVTFADPSGHKTFGAILGDALRNATGIGKNSNTGNSSSGYMGAKMGNLVQSVKKSADIMANTVKNTISSTVGSSNNSKGGGSSGGTASLLDSIKSYNRTDYDNSLIAGMEVTTLMGSPYNLTWEESIATIQDAKRCLGYDNCVNLVQQGIVKRRGYELDAMGLPYAGAGWTINGKQAPEIIIDGWLKLYTHPTVNANGRIVGRHPMAKLFDWGMDEDLEDKLESKDVYPTNSTAATTITNNGGNLVANMTSNNLYTDADGRYWVAVGPNVINPNFTTGMLTNTLNGSYGTKMDIVVSDRNGNIYYIPATLGDVREHTSPFGIPHTGIPYDKKRRTADGDRSTIEFIGYDITEYLDPSDNRLKSSINVTNNYALEKIIVYDGVYNY